MVGWVCYNTTGFLMQSTSGCSGVVVGSQQHTQLPSPRAAGPPGFFRCKLQ